MKSLKWKSNIGLKSRTHASETDNEPDPISRTCALNTLSSPKEEIVKVFKCIIPLRKPENERGQDRARKRRDNHISDREEMMVSQVQVLLFGEADTNVLQNCLSCEVSKGKDKKNQLQNIQTRRTLWLGLCVVQKSWVQDPCKPEFQS